MWVWVVVGLLFAAVPLIVWGMLVRTREIGSLIGVLLLAGACWLVAVQYGWISAHRPDAHVLYAVAATLVITAGVLLERMVEGPGSVEWGYRRGTATGLLVAQLGVTFAGSVLYVLMGGEASVPPASAVPSLPPGLTVVKETKGCGSGNCARLLEIGSTTGLSRDEIVRKLGYEEERCRPNSWLLDRRKLCVGVDDMRADADRKVVLYVTLSNLID